MGDDIEKRKDHHLDLVLSEDVEGKGLSPLFEHVHLVHDALPELALDGLALSTTVLGRTLRAPLLVVGMTGGTARAGAINRDLAAAAQARGVAFGVGSQRAMHVSPARAPTVRVREVAPDIVIFGNVGAQQIQSMGVAGVRALMEDIGADGIFVHLNPGQELVQPGGDRDFRGCLDGILRLADALGPRVWVKETGCGLSRTVAQRLVAAGVGGLDVSGGGGTSWTHVEQLRASGMQKQLGQDLNGWGIPTAAAVAACSDLGVPVVASGGLRSGIDVAKGIALGATLGGMALPYLRAQAQAGREGVEAALESVETGLRAAMLLSGSRDLASLQKVSRVLTGELPAWIAALRGAA
jgi:isopentenyl-diphosphate delta-isomerase